MVVNLKEGFASTVVVVVCVGWGQALLVRSQSPSTLDLFIVLLALFPNVGALSSLVHSDVLGTVRVLIIAPCSEASIPSPLPTLHSLPPPHPRVTMAASWPAFTLSTTFILNGVANNVNSAAFALATVDLDPATCLVWWWMATIATTLADPECVKVKL